MQGFAASKIESVLVRKGVVSQSCEAAPFSFKKEVNREMSYKGGKIIPCKGVQGAFWVEVWDRKGRYLGKRDRVSQGIAAIDEAERQLVFNF